MRRAHLATIIKEILFVENQERTKLNNRVFSAAEYFSARSLLLPYAPYIPAYFSASRRFSHRINRTESMSVRRKYLRCVL